MQKFLAFFILTSMIVWAENAEDRRAADIEQIRTQLKTSEGKPGVDDEHLTNTLVKNTNYKYEQASNYSYGDYCLKMPKVGSCPATAKIALVAYNPITLNSQREVREGITYNRQNSPGGDCAVLDSELKAQNYCVESLPLTHSQSIEDAIADYAKAKPPINLNQRYDYMGIVAHGSPGKWHSGGSACEVKAWGVCNGDKKMTLTEYEECMSTQMSAAANKDACPCYQELADSIAQFKSRQAKVLAKADFTTTQLQCAGVAAASAKVGQCEEKNRKYYSDDQDPTTVTKLLKKDAQLFAASCDTGADKEEAVRFANKICAAAPEGLNFNLARQPTVTARIIPKEMIRQCSACIVDEFQKGHSCREDAERLYNFYRDYTEDLKIKGYGDFICYTCTGGLAIRQADCAKITAMSSQQRKLNPSAPSRAEPQGPDDQGEPAGDGPNDGVDDYHHPARKK